MMIKHLLKQIWTQRAVNAWLWLELVVVAVCLAYVTDYLYVTGKIYYSPLGVDVEHVYRVDLDMVGPESKEYLPTENDSTRTERLFDVLARLRAYPGVEAVSVSDGSHPYNRRSMNGSRGIDTTWVHASIYRVAPEFFRVFQIADKQGQTSPLVSAATRKNVWIASVEAERQFAASGVVAQGSGIKNWGEEEPHHTVAAICEDVRFDDFNAVYPVYYECDSEADILKDRGTGAEFCVRVSPMADNADFASRFRKDLKKLLRLGNIYLVEVTSFGDIRDSYYRSGGQINDVKTRIAALCFLLVNILLGVVGTFWIRTQQRRPEIGLRQALGSSRTGIRSLLMTEGLLLLVLSALPALVISFHIGWAGIAGTDLLPFTWDRFVIVEAITLLLMGLMIVAGIYVPARQAMKVQPAEALHEE